MPGWHSYIFLIPLMIIAIFLIIGKGFFKNIRVVGRNGSLRYEPTELNLTQMRNLAGLSDLNNLREIVKKISVKRVVGTPEHSAVRNYIMEYLKELNWTVQLDIFTEKVPIFGYVSFENIVARQNPSAKRYLMLGCHYDSKYFKDFVFKAATNSAVSCAMMLNMAKILKDQFSRSEISLMFVFFDGKEAFKDWSAKDSLYGSRHLADLWEKKGFLDRIDLFLLLNLIGVRNIKFKNNILNTSSWFHRFVQIEQQLTKAGVLQLERPIFQFESSKDIDDDHLPFLQHNVPVIHLIAAEYPANAVLTRDVEQNVDYEITLKVDVILRMFVMEYLNSAPSSSIGLTHAIH